MELFMAILQFSPDKQSTSFGTQKRGSALRYPDDVALKGQPFIMFTGHRAKYVKGAQQTQMVDNSSVALYMPPGFQVGDIMRYEGGASGALGSIGEKLMDQGFSATLASFNSQDLQDVAETFAGRAAQATAGAFAATLGGPAAGIVSAVGAGGIGAAVDATRAKRRQTGMNPQEFMLFKAPNSRQFSFTFNFFPESVTEADSATKIIKYFRTRMYPKVTANDLMYKFPEVFSITFGSIGDEVLPKIAESALTNATMNYNPNSMSYFSYKGQPVEISMTLSFQELMPLTAENIEEGF
ncbi:MAG TPA: hypothetical protein DCW83_05685 [Saprospirales bacterium]|nr:hypothetical protein [Saprospirales bacterium]